MEGSTIKKFDLSADNGMVHVIDKVMMPPSGSIVDIVAGDSDFSTLLKQVQSAGLASALQGKTLCCHDFRSVTKDTLMWLFTAKIHKPSLKSAVLYHES